MKDLRFYKDEWGWFVDLPEWEGDVMDLQMVSGADVLCEIIAQGESEFKIMMSDVSFPGSNILKFKQLGRLEGFEMGTGAWYILEKYNGVEYNLPMWLCDVTKHPLVFGEFPVEIYFL
jgi:hypothetical protein